MREYAGMIRGKIGELNAEIVAIEYSRNLLVDNEEIKFIYFEAQRKLL